MTVKELFEAANGLKMEKTASVDKEETQMIKTAQEEMSELGKIAGYAMAAAFLEKLAEAQAIPPEAEVDPVPEVVATPEAKAPAAQGVDPQNTAPQQVPTQNLEAETMTAGEAIALLKKMTPSEIGEFINSCDPALLEELSQDPEIASILDNAIAQIEAAPVQVVS